MRHEKKIILLFKYRFLVADDNTLVVNNFVA